MIRDGDLLISLGIEGTAHTISCGIVDENRILSNVNATYRPETGGIHPRAAADHHFTHVLQVIKGALNDSGVSMHDVDLVCFSRGPGLGPCLRIAATSARALSLKWNKPLLGVNHPLGHVEIGRKLSGAKDPVMLYVSGGNTQVIAHKNGRYRVFGETMDIGLGNMIDKFARSQGIPFPGGPQVEKLARKGVKLLELPYSVRGMDTSFSGMLTASLRYMEKGESLEDVSFSIQETAFSMIVEVLERAMYHLDKGEILLAGGVAMNERLREMVSHMAMEAGVKHYLTDKKYCMDNGAMIAQAGLLMYESGQRQTLEDTRIDQRFRIDEVAVPWIAESEGNSRSDVGAEASVVRRTFFERDAVEKIRKEKNYRIPDLDLLIRRERARNECKNILSLRSHGIGSPMIFAFYPHNFSITMERIDGATLKEYISENGDHKDIITDLGIMVKKMHEAGISHGDLTTSNIMVGNDHSLFLIDPSMGNRNATDAEMAHDLFLLFESFSSEHSQYPDLKECFLSAYSGSEKCDNLLDELKKIEARRRYV